MNFQYLLPDITFGKALHVIPYKNETIARKIVLISRNITVTMWYDVDIHYLNDHVIAVYECQTPIIIEIEIEIEMEEGWSNRPTSTST